MVVTGKIELREGRVFRPGCEKRIDDAGGIFREKFSNSVDLIVQGDLENQPVVDPELGHSEKLDEARKRSNRGGRHTHVVDQYGFQALLDGSPARCRKILATSGTVHLAPDEPAGLPDVPLTPRAVPIHDAQGLTLDLALLDAGTAAHEATVEALIFYLELTEVAVVKPRPGEPLFDAAWHHNGRMYLAEVKSLTGAHQDQQIRLGVGQVLDYTHQMQHRTPCPVLVLEKEPDDGRWLSMAEAVGIVLTWAPDFPRVG